MAMVPMLRRIVFGLLSVGALAANAGAADAEATPKAETLDRLQYVFTKGFFFDATVVLTVTKGGKVEYSYKPRAFTGIESRVVTKTWEMPEKDARALLSGLVEDGLLEAEAHEDWIHARGPYHYVSATFGAWHLQIRPKKIPENAFRRLLPVLQKADPGEWKVAEARPALPDGRRIDSFSTSFERSYGEVIWISVAANGKVAYSHHTRSDIGRAPGKPVREEWDIPVKDAVALLAKLVASGVSESEKKPVVGWPGPHTVVVGYGRWRLTRERQALPGESFQRLLPLLQKGEPAEWKISK